MALFLGNLPKDQAWENWVQALRHSRNESGGPISFDDVRKSFRSEIVRRTVGVSGSSGDRGIAALDRNSARPRSSTSSFTPGINH